MNDPTDATDRPTVDLTVLTVAFKELLADFGITPDFATEYTAHAAPALLALVAAAFGADVTMPQSTLATFAAFRAQLGAQPSNTPDRIVPPAEVSA